MTELDNHADTCVVGNDTALLIHDFERPVRVFGYDGRQDNSTVNKTVTGVLGYTSPKDGNSYMLVIHQAILVPHLKSNLLGTMQMRDNGIWVNNEPKHLTPNPTDEHHCIYCPATADTVELRIPLWIKGVVSCFPTYKPTTYEYESIPLERIIELTSETIDWDPQVEMRFQEQEAAMLDENGTIRDKPYEVGYSRYISSLYTLPQADYPDDNLGTALVNAVRIKVSYVSAVSTGTRQYPVTPELLAKRWNIGIDAATRTVECTTQRSVRTILHPTLSRRFRTNDRQLRYRRLSHNLFTDTLEASEPSWFRKNRYAQVFATRFGWVRAYPMQKKSDAHEALSLLAQRDGVPPMIVMDGSKEQTLGTFRKKAREMDCRVRQTEPYSPWQNAAESEIRELKRGAGRKMSKSHAPYKLWDHCLELESYVRSNTARNTYELQGQTPETMISGQTSDISPFVEHAWYDWVKYYDSNSSYPEPKERLGRWLGPSIDIGPAMTSKILKANGQVLHLSSYRALSNEEIEDAEELKERNKFDNDIHKKLGNPQLDQLPSELEESQTPEYERYSDDFEGTHQYIPEDSPTTEEMDEYLGAEVTLPVRGDLLPGTVVKRARSQDGGITGTRDSNPLLDTRKYQVKFSDGQVSEYSANVIAENMYAQCDSQGKRSMLMDAIIDYDTTAAAIKHADRYITVKGRQRLRKTTAGWKLCVQWKNGSTSWERLTDMKDSYPIEVAEYAIANGIDKEPAFAWWVHDTLHKRDHIIAAVNKRYFNRTHKFGIEIPKNVKRALQIDEENGNTLWRDAIEKEMSAVRVAFKVLDEDISPPPGYQYMECHMIFDVKLDGFRRKARLVAGGHMTATPDVVTYSSVVSRETVRITLTVAALNDLEVKGSDVENAYLTAPCDERIWTILGPEFGPDAGKRALIVRALYGLKSAGASFNRHLSDCMRHIGYEPCRADPDLWFKAVIRPDDGFKYYAYILLYVDDALAVHHDAMAALIELDHYFKMKPGSIGPPNIYLGSKLRQVTLDNGVVAWSSSSSKYVQDAVANVEAYLMKNYDGRKLAKRCSGPWPNQYLAELDESPELSPTKANYYQSQIGVLHWIVELGRIDIVTEVSILASYMAMPREDHLEAIFHVFAYLKKRHNSQLVFDPTYPDINKDDFLVCDWKHTYGEVEEAIPPNAPEPRGKEVDIRLFVDSDHAGDQKTRRSWTGYIAFLNCAPISWLSKKQATIETSVFGTEFVAMKIGTEYVRGLRYKLRMMGVGLTGPAFIYGDNMSVVHNSQRPESTLKKKSNQICYHAVREAVAMGECLIGHTASGENPADIATKIIPGGMKRDYLVNKLLYDITDNH